ncbi:hypothetical protein ACWD7F_38815 [Streptomyces sp. NPDC005122]
MPGLTEAFVGSARHASERIEVDALSARAGVTRGACDDVAVIVVR